MYTITTYNIRTSKADIDGTFYSLAEVNVRNVTTRTDVPMQFTDFLDLQRESVAKLSPGESGAFKIGHLTIH
jgi:hypothetical protein